MPPVAYPPRSNANNAVVWLDAADAIEGTTGPLPERFRPMIGRAAELLDPFVASSIIDGLKLAARGLSGASELASEYRYAVAAAIEMEAREPTEVLAEHQKLLHELASGHRVSRLKRVLLVRFLDTLASEYQSANSVAATHSELFRNGR